MKIVDKDKLCESFEIDNNAELKASPFVFKNGAQYKEMQEERPWLKKLMNELDSEPFYIIKEDGKYQVDKKCNK